MSNLEELIERLCPDGVEYKTLGEVATDIYRGAGIKRDQIRKTGTPCVRYGEIYTTYGIFFDSCVSYTDESLLTTKKYFEYGDILFAITGERVEDIAKSCAYVGHEKCLAGGDIVVLKHNEDPKYLSYALATTDARRQKSFGKSKNKVVHSSVPAIKSIKLPVPPLEVQREIVRILDNFTLLTAELAAELAARQKQYEYYRDLLLTFKPNESTILNERTNELELSGTIRWMKLGDIADIGTGNGNTNEGLDTGKYPFFVRSQDIKYKNEYDFDETAIITSGDGVGVGKIFHFVSGKYALHQRAYRVHITSDNVLPKYFFYYFKNSFLAYISKASFHSSVTSIRRPMMINFPVPVPPLEVQQSIVDIIDRFDTLCNDITSGLPAEIEMRQKQYEYYRDKLLTFKELKKEA
ncbi:restriction endonuclease subunit S [Phascolarctobacterium succinatutens]|uniref:restriction endonuclease subunit S n=1 Tax=Phascolarctobacterium succinatutens TaxID=626940 RepID=UPI0026ED4E94|nr:restriction endonuclease subunit S [Phascolarctobacterium succinatutens]